MMSNYAFQHNIVNNNSNNNVNNIQAGSSVITIDDLFFNKSVNDVFQQQQEQTVITSIDELFATSEGNEFLFQSTTLDHHDLTEQALFPSNQVTFNNNYSSNYPNSDNGKITGMKRPSSTGALSYLNNHYEFPPIAIAHDSSFTAQHKKFIANTSSYSYNNLSSLATTTTTATSTEQQSEKSFPSSTPTSGTVHQSLLFTPKLISLEDRLCNGTRTTNSFVSSLTCEQIIEQIEKILRNNFNHNSNNNNNNQKIYHSYNAIEFSWNIFFMKSSNHCQMKLQIYQIEQQPPSHVDGSSTSSLLASPSDIKERAVHNRYLLDLKYEDGDKSLFYCVYHEFHHGLTSYEDDTKEMSFHLQSIGIQENNNIEGTTPTSSMKSISKSTSNSNFLLSPSVSGGASSRKDNASGKVLATTALTASCTEVFCNNYDFYSRNKHILKSWLSDLNQYDSPMTQLEALKQILNLVNSSCEEPSMLKMIEDYGFINELLDFFQVPIHCPMSSQQQSMNKVSSTTTATIQEQKQEQGKEGKSKITTIVSYHEEELWLKPYSIQILVQLIHRKESMKRMSENQHLIDYCHMICHHHHDSNKNCTNNHQQMNFFFLKDDCQKLNSAILQYINRSHGGIVGIHEPLHTTPNWSPRAQANALKPSCG